MSLKSALPLALATAFLSLAGNSFAQTYTETGDAGDLPTAAQIITGAVGAAYTSITGTTTGTNNVFDSDMFRITLGVAESLKASTTAFVVGANNFDTQIALFNSAGVGILANDDAAAGGSQSSLTTGVLPAGNYYLLISGSGRYATDSTGKLIFPNFTDGTTDPSATVAATSTSPIAAYTGNSNEGGKYVIALSVVPGAVPEPASLVYVIAGAAGLALVSRRNRRTTGK